ncbi:MAG: A/G-specific adenine glycosylase [Chitinophagaceae bacterium]|nr:A/G-specific adenine glycosylase [Chitinophagaceae bacterium]
MDLKKYFQQQLLYWHDTENNRLLPWKEEKNVYRIWLSEIILQQTRAEQGMKYYERFIKAYPTIQKLAKAPLEEVYKLWEGLGYYNRCKNLHSTAQKIAFELKGKFPNTYDSILELKGIGPYTAAAISSFGFGLPYAVVDGNVFRVLSRFFGVDDPVDSTSGKKIFQQLAQDCLATKEPAAYNQAIMDFGAVVCKPDLPDCANCVMQKKCIAFQTSAVASYPVKEKKTKQRSRWFLFYILEQNGRFAVQKRTAKDVWANLYEFPNEEFAEEKLWKQAAKKDAAQWLNAKNINSAHQLLTITKPLKQQLSHQMIYANAVLIRLKNNGKKIKQYEWKSITELKHLPFPKILNDFLNAKILQLFQLNDAVITQKT